MSSERARDTVDNRDGFGAANIVVICASSSAVFCCPYSVRASWVMALLGRAREGQATIGSVGSSSGGLDCSGNVWAEHLHLNAGETRDSVEAVMSLVKGP